MKLKIMHFSKLNERVKDGIDVSDKRKQKKYIEKLFDILSLDKTIIIEIDDYSFSWFTNSKIFVKQDDVEKFMTLDDARALALSLVKDVVCTLDVF